MYKTGERESEWVDGGVIYKAIIAVWLSVAKRDEFVFNDIQFLLRLLKYLKPEFEYEPWKWLNNDICRGEGGNEIQYGNCRQSIKSALSIGDDLHKQVKQTDLAAEQIATVRVVGANGFSLWCDKFMSIAIFTPFRTLLV